MITVYVIACLRRVLLHDNDTTIVCFVHLSGLFLTASDVLCIISHNISAMNPPLFGAVLPRGQRVPRGFIMLLICAPEGCTRNNLEVEVV